MSKSTLADRRIALENHFFHEQEERNLSRLREELATQKSKEELQKSSGLEDQHLLNALVTLDISASDLSALTLLPLVQVAWSDGSIKPEEREAILNAANANNISKESHSFQLLTAWLDTKPNPSLFQAWADYVAQLRVELDSNFMETLQESILGLAHDVASAAGGILGIGSISSSEKATLATITAVFEA